MADEDERDTTYSHVSHPPTRRRKKRATSARSKPTDKTLVSVPPSEDEDELERSRHGLSVEDIEVLIAAGEYDKVRAILGPPDRAAKLPPQLALLYIAARGEIEHGAELADLPHLAVQTSAALLDVNKQSRAARLVAKRLLGLSASTLERRPPANLPVILIASALAIGLVIGWLAARTWS